MEVKNHIVLTTHQDERLDVLFNALAEKRKRILLKGSAGVGKTTLVNFLLESVLWNIGKNKKIYVAAPTHKALSVLNTKIDYNEEDHPIVFCTVHKGLKLKMKTNTQTGVRSFVQKFPKYDPPFGGCEILIIDEASMLSQKMLDYLEQYDFPIIFLGDEKQINPVKEKDSPVFHQNWFEVELTEIIRQGEGNPIIELSRNLPRISDGKEYTIGEGEERTGFLYTNDRNKVIHKLAEVNGTDELKYLAWTNAEVDSINFSVRSTIYGNNPALIEQGEVLVLNAQYVDSEEEIYYNNFELRVETLEETVATFYCGNEMFEYKVYLINGTIYAIHEDFIGLHRQNIKRLKALAINKVISWVQWYDFQAEFLDFKYNHAITVHKSQGSTYKHVIMNVKDINRNRLKEEKQRLLYTAVTRASDLVILYNA